MCGLIAYYKASERPLDPQLIEDMTHALAHRGPDDYGFCFAGDNGPVLWRNAHNTPPLRERGVAMGHRRISIFDLSTAGRQPFVSADKRYAILFNGEIYNYVELREELVQRGHRFSTDCDTEVLLAAYQDWGPDCFNRLNGVFGIVVWDHQTKELVVARDRLGEKPMLYTCLDGDWIFTSEVKALLKHPGITLRPNEQSLLQFLANGWSPIGEECYFADIKAVEPGTYLTLRNGNVKKTRFWDIATMDKRSPRSDATAAEELDELLTDAVRIRLRGDLRVGAMLSGGLDSTSVISSIGTVLESRPSDGRMIGDRLQAFTASFPGMPIDETDKVEELCRSIDIAVHKIFPSEQSNVEERLNAVAFSMEGPFWNPAILVNDSLMKLVSGSDAQIVLDGLGGDELFAGYGRHLPLALRDSLHGLRFGEAMGNLAGMKRWHGCSMPKELVRAMLPRRWHDGLQSSLEALRGERKSPDAELFRSPLRDQGRGRAGFGGSSELDRALRSDLVESNVPRWLEMGDRISMAHTVVSRSPFFDHRLIEFAFGLDNGLKIRKGKTKHLLREAKRRQLPPIIVNDFRKLPFSGPGSIWLNGSLKSLALSLKDEKATKLAAFLHPKPLGAIVDDFFANSGAQGGAIWRLWRLLSAEAWLRAYF